MAKEVPPAEAVAEPWPWIPLQKQKYIFVKAFCHSWNFCYYRALYFQSAFTPREMSPMLSVSPRPGLVFRDELPMLKLVSSMLQHMTFQVSVILKKYSHFHGHYSVIICTKYTFSSVLIIM